MFDLELTFTAMKIVSLKISTLIKLAMLQTKNDVVAIVAKLSKPIVDWFVLTSKGFIATNSTLDGMPLS